QRFAKNRIQDATSAGCVPEQRKRRPLPHHGGASCSGNGERNAERDEAEDRLNRQLQRLSADENRVATRQIGEMRTLKSQERSEQNEKGGRCKSREDSPLKAQCFPEHVSVAERLEPEHVHVIRQCGPAAEDDAGKDGENEKETTATARPRLMRRRPVNGLGHCSTPFSLTPYSYPHNTPSAAASCFMARPSPHRCTAKAVSLLKGSLRVGGTSFAADERRFSRLRLDRSWSHAFSCPSDLGIVALCGVPK